MKLHWALASAFMALLEGCASVRLYPVCQYAGIVPSETKAEFIQSTRAVLKSLDIQETSEQGGVLPDMRYATVKALPWQLARLAGFWPEISCVGKYSNMEDRAKYTSCLQYVANSLLYEQPGAPEDSLLCFISTKCPDRIPQSVDAVIYCNGTSP